MKTSVFLTVVILLGLAQAQEVDLTVKDSPFIKCDDQGVCVHKNVWPLQPIEITGTAVLTVLMALAVMSGVGGGGIIVPLLIVFYELETKAAIAVSGCTILSGSIARFFITFKQRHPHKDATTIDYGISNIMLPTVLCGSLSGVVFNIVFPSVVLQICLTLLLAFLTYNSGKKFLQIYKQENKQAQVDAESKAHELQESPEKDGTQDNIKPESKDGKDEETMTDANRAAKVSHASSEGRLQETPKRSDSVAIEMEPTGTLITSDENEAEKIEYEKIIELEKGHGQLKKQGINFFMFLLLCLLNFFRGSKAKPSVFGVKPCSSSDWISQLIYIAACVLISRQSIKVVQHEQALKIKYAKGLASSDIELQGSTLTRLLMFSFLGGWVSGALGLGGGSIFNPLLLSFGVPPKVASSTGMYMIIFSTGASTMTYIAAGKLEVSYGLWVGSFCVFGTIIGMSILNTCMHRLGRQSPLVFLLSFILGISALSVPYFGLGQIAKSENLWELGNYCAQ